MNNKQNTMLVLLLLSMPIFADNPQSDMVDLGSADWFGEADLGSVCKQMMQMQQKMFDDMRRLDEQFNQSMSKMNITKVPKIDLVCEQDAEYVYIKIKNLPLAQEQVDNAVHRKGNIVRIDVTTEDGRSINAEIDKQTIHLITKQERMHEEKKDDTVISSYQSSIARSLPSRVELNDIYASYDEESQTLTIRLAKSEDEAEQRIPVVSGSMK